MRTFKAFRGVVVAACLAVTVLLLTMAGDAMAEAATHCVKATKETKIVNGKSKHVYTGGWTNKACTATSATHEGKYEEIKASSLTEPEQTELKALLKYVKVVPEGIDKKPTVQVSGANVQVVANPAGKEEETTGLGNLIIGYDESPGTQTGSNNLVLGTALQTYTSFGAILGGYDNTVEGPYTSVSGGYGNNAKGAYSSVSGGGKNNATETASSVSGGYVNKAEGEWSSVTGGSGNTASGVASLVSGGEENAASGAGASVSGGGVNKATEALSSVSGGNANTAAGEWAWVGGGGGNKATGILSSVSGGEANTASGGAASVTGGGKNNATETASSASGGEDNNAEGEWSSVTGGDKNKAEGKYSAILGGKQNTLKASEEFSYFP